MKNLFLSLVFMLVGSLGFASNEVNEITKNEQLEKLNHYVIGTSCGVTLTISTSNELSVDDQFDICEYMEDLWC